MGKNRENQVTGFIAFYNGTKEEPERQILELNAAYQPGFDKENAALQCRAVVININLGYNEPYRALCLHKELYEAKNARRRQSTWV